MKSIFEPACARGSPATVDLPPRAARQAARAAGPVPASKPPGAKPCAAPWHPAPTARAAQPPDPEFRAWLEELL